MAGSEEFDLEQISAFIDGRLSGEERRRALRLLQESEAAFEVYSDALRARADLVNGQVVPLATMRGRRNAPPWRTIGSLAAAAVVLIAVLPMVEARRDRAVIDVTSVEIAGPLTRSPRMRSPEIRTLLADVSDGRGWSVTRGGNGRLVDSTIAFRLGVRAVDVQMALTQRDTLRADRLVREIRESLDGVKWSDAANAEYSALQAGLARGDPVDQLTADALRAERELDEFLQSFWFGFGRWVGAGEVAARARSAEFFASSRTERFLETAAATGDLSASDAELLLQIGVLAGQGVTDEEFETIREHFRTLIRRHGG